MVAACCWPRSLLPSGPLTAEGTVGLCMWSACAYVNHDRRALPQTTSLQPRRLPRSTHLRLCCSPRQKATLRMRRIGQARRSVPDFPMLWSTIQTALDELFQPLVEADDFEHISSASIASPKTYIDAYTAAQTWIKSRGDLAVSSVPLYERIESYLEGVCKTLSLRLSSTSTSSAAWLRTYTTIFDSYRKRTAVAARILAQLDQTYLKRETDELRGWFRPAPGWSDPFPRASHNETLWKAEHAELVKHWGLSPDAPYKAKDFSTAVHRAEAGSPSSVHVSILGTGLRQWRLQVVVLQEDAANGLLSRLADVEDEALKAQVLQSLRDVGLKQNVDMIDQDEPRCDWSDLITRAVV
jgi:hypothetical protein